MITEIQPLFDRVVVRPAAPETQRGVLYLPENAQEPPQTGEVIAVCEYLESVKVGDNVLYGKYSGADIEVNGEQVRIMRAEEILAIVRCNTKAKSA